MTVDCCLIDGTDVLYNKFNVSSSSPPDNPPQHPNSDYNCVVATTAQWRVSRCDQQHRVVCQSDTLIGIMAICLQQIICSRIQWLVLCVLGFYFFVDVPYTHVMTSRTWSQLCTAVK